MFFIFNEVLVDKLTVRISDTNLKLQGNQCIIFWKLYIFIKHSFFCSFSILHYEFYSFVYKLISFIERQLVELGLSLVRETNIYELLE